jgi:hypothetical protein
MRFYTGRPSPNTDPAGARNLDRRLGIMRREGVTVVTRPLRYHWDWGHPGQRLPAPGSRKRMTPTRICAYRRVARSAVLRRGHGR